jgi:glucokinase-like ROK family protein
MTDTEVGRMNHPLRRLIHNTRSGEAEERVVASRGADVRAMREFNLLLALNCIRERGPLPRVAIARLTGLSRPTISSLMEILLQERLVREGEFLNSSAVGGRRAVQVHFNANAGYVIGADVGRTHLTLLLTNLGAEIQARHSEPFDSSLGAQACLPLLVERIRTFVEAADTRWDQIVGIGVGVPGPIDTGRRQLVSPPRLPGWDRVDLYEALQRELEVPIFLDNDANMGTLGESRYGAGRGVPNMAYIKLGTGVGGGLIMNGAIYRGVGSAGELGHVTIDADGPECACGNRGCLEALAGAGAIVEDANRRAGAQIACTIAEVIQAAQEGHPACRAALERAGESIGVAVADLINLCNPSLILIDGGVSRAGDLLLTSLRRTVAARSLPVAWAKTTIELAQLGDNAIALGAVSTVLDAAFGVSSATLASPMRALAMSATIS